MKQFNQMKGKWWAMKTKKKYYDQMGARIKR